MRAMFPQGFVACVQEIQMRHRIGLLLRKHARPTHTSESEGEVECILGVQKKGEKLSTC